MTNSDRDQELLQKYMDHLLPQDNERLKKIKQRVGSDVFRSRRKATLKKRANHFYAASITSILLCAVTFGGYRFLLRNQLLDSHAISNIFVLNILNNIQNPKLLTLLYIFLSVLFICAVAFLWRGFIIQKKSEKL